MIKSQYCEQFFQILPTKNSKSLKLLTLLLTPTKTKKANKFKWLQK